MYNLIFTLGRKEVVWGVPPWAEMCQEPAESSAWGVGRPLQLRGMVLGCGELEVCVSRLSFENFCHYCRLGKRMATAIGPVETGEGI